MIIVRTPLRIPIAGGGTDLPIWHEKHGGMFISAAIDKYIYITLQKSNYNSGFNLRYSKQEQVEKIEDIEHDILRESFKYFGIEGPISLTSHADIPSNTGLGSSGSFGVGVIHAIYPQATKEFLAKKSSKIQMDILKWPVGWQDQYVASYGGFKTYPVGQNGTVKVFNMKLQQEKLLEKLVLFYTGYQRNTTQILASSSVGGLEKIQDLAWVAKKALEEANFDKYGHLLNEHWQEKKKRHPEMSNLDIDGWYELGLRNGALGGKLLGAGGGGFLMFYTNDREKLIKAMPLKYQEFNWDFEGSKIIYNE